MKGSRWKAGVGVRERVCVRGNRRGCLRWRGNERVNVTSGMTGGCLDLLGEGARDLLGEGARDLLGEGAELVEHVRQSRLDHALVRAARLQRSK